MHNDLITQTRYRQELLLRNEQAAGSRRKLRREAQAARARSEARAAEHTIRDAFGHGLISIGEKLVGHAHPEPQFEAAA